MKSTSISGLNGQNTNDKHGPLQIYFPDLQLLRLRKATKTFWQSEHHLQAISLWKRQY